MSPASSSTSPPTAGVAAKKAQATQTRPVRSRRTCSPRRSRASSTRTARTTRTCKYVVIVGGDRRSRSSATPTRACSARNPATCRRSTATRRPRRACAATSCWARMRTARARSVSLRTSNFPVPGLAVGRLVETPSEIAGLIDAYIETGGVVVPGSSLVTGYDFLADAANAVQTELQSGHRRALRHADRAERHVARGPAVLDGRPTSAPSCSAAATTSSSWPGTSAPTARSRPTSRRACSRPTSPRRR